MILVDFLVSPRALVVFCAFQLRLHVQQHLLLLVDGGAARTLSLRLLLDSASLLDAIVPPLLQLSFSELLPPCAEPQLQQLPRNTN